MGRAGGDVNQPIRALRAGNDMSTGVCSEILRCEGFPWLDDFAANDFDAVPPGVRLLMVAGTGLTSTAAEWLVRAVADGTSVIALAPDPELASAFGVEMGAPVTNAHLTVADLSP